MMQDGERELTLHPDRQGLRMVLGDLEAEVMDVIWRCPDGEWCTVRDVYETMLQDRRIAYTTVMNTMTRLANKGVLESTRRDMAYLYRPHQSREAFIHGVVGHVLDRLLVQFKGPTQAALANYKANNPADAEKVEQLLSELSRQRGPGSTSKRNSSKNSRETSI
jgi:predicted transcriptional regulator